MFFEFYYGLNQNFEAKSVLPARAVDVDRLPFGTRRPVRLRGV